MKLTRAQIDVLLVLFEGGTIWMSRSNYSGMAHLCPRKILGSRKVKVRPTLASLEEHDLIEQTGNIDINWGLTKKGREKVRSLPGTAQVLLGTAGGEACPLHSQCVVPAGHNSACVNTEGKAVYPDPGDEIRQALGPIFTNAQLAKDKANGDWSEDRPDPAAEMDEILASAKRIKEIVNRGIQYRKRP